MGDTKKKIGLVMSCSGSSYGMNLQAYATQYMIEKLGYDTEIIQFKSGSGLKGLRVDIGLLVFIIKRLKARFVTGDKMKEINDEILCDDVHINNDQLRIKEAQRFRDQRLQNFTKQMEFEELSNYCKKYEAVLIGSDQGWLPGFALGRRNSLRFVPKGVLRLSYATSLGVSSYPWYYYSSSRSAWKAFDHISVREEEGRNVIREICGKDFPVEVVVDPTYLITEEEWNELIPFERQEEERYVLSFMLGNNEDQLNCIRRFADNKHLKLVSIMSNESSSPIDMTYPDRVIVGASPEQFINLIRGAEYVFTDSFHGIAFSVINRKQLFAFYRKRAEDGNKQTRNSRIDNILRLWNIKERLIKDPMVNWGSFGIDDIDYEVVRTIIIKERARSLDFLQKILP